MLIYDCTTIKGAEAYASNVAADIIAIIASVITCLWYGYSFLQRWKEARSAPIQETNKERAGRTLRQTGLPVLPLASLSALWASALGFIFLYAGEQTWPQILEGLALMTVVYAQVSALIWQEHDPEGWIKDMADRIPDVIAVIVAIVTLWFVRNAYIQDSQNSFYTSHDPLQEVILSIALTALGFTIGVFQEGFFCSAARRSGTAYSNVHFAVNIIFVLLQAGICIATFVYGITTIAQGCPTFNATKVTALVTLIFGLAYSIALVPIKRRNAQQSALQYGAPDVLTGVESEELAALRSNYSANDANEESFNSTRLPQNSSSSSSRG